MQVTDELVRNVVQEVLSHMRQGNGRAIKGPTPSARQWGVFDDVDSAVKAAVNAQKEFGTRGLTERRKAIDCIRRICISQAEPLGREEFEETRIGRVEHKIDKMRVVGGKTPGVEFLRSDAFSGENGITLTEYAPFGVIGIITPVTHSLPTLVGN